MMGVIKKSLFTFVCFIPFLVFAEVPKATIEEAAEKCTNSAYSFALEIVQLLSNKVPIEEIVLNGGHPLVVPHQKEFVTQLYKNNTDAAIIALNKAVDVCIKLETESNI